MDDREIFDNILTELNLTHRREEILGLDFNKFEDHKMIHLDLGLMEISDIPEGLFDQLNNLTMLNLSGNPITKLPTGIFDKLPKLTAIGLNNCKIKELSQRIVDNQANLEYFSIGGNQLENRPGWIDDLITKGVKVSEERNPYSEQNQA